jgi:hypothetical protein
MRHFLRLAKRGKPNTGASGGELRARRLALAVLDNIPGLDDDAVAGLVQFIALAKAEPETARSYVDGWEDNHAQA